MGRAKKYGNNFEIIRQREENYLIRIADSGTGVDVDDYQEQRMDNFSIAERLKASQLAVYAQLGAMAGWWGMGEVR